MKGSSTGKSSVTRLVVRLIGGSLIGAIAISSIIALSIAIDGLTDKIHPADVAIIPGNRVNPDGKPSSWLQARLDKTLVLYRQGLFSHVIVSGGFGKEGFDEAVVMKQYLVAAGIPDQAVLVDHEGNDTYLTARNSATIMAENGWTTALVVSQFYQIPRTRLALNRFGIKQIYSAHAQGLTSNGIISLAREVPAYVVYFFRPY